LVKSSDPYLAPKYRDRYDCEMENLISYMMR